MLPEGKVEAVRRLKSTYGQIAFVGDGINDAPALAEADVGLAIGTGTDIAVESADVVLMSGNLQGVPNAIALSKATLGNIRQNLFWAFAYNTALIPVAAGVYPVWGAAVAGVRGRAMALSSVRAGQRTASAASSHRWPAVAGARGRCDGAVQCSCRATPASAPLPATDGRRRCDPLKENRMNIGEAAASNVSAKMIRYYEQIGLIPAADRTESGYRAYSQADIHRLRFIAARAISASRWPRSATCLWNDTSRHSADVKQLAEQHIADLEQRIEHMRQMADTLKSLIRCCAGDERPECPILQRLGEDDEDPLPVETVKPARCARAFRACSHEKPAL